MYKYIGSMIQHLRKSKGLTQKQLSFNLCSIKHLSRIESNQSNPTAYLLSEFSHRLGNGLNELLTYSDCPLGYYVGIEMKSLILLFENHQHKELLDKLEQSDYLRKTISQYARKEMAWLKGATNHYIKISDDYDEDYFRQLIDPSQTTEALLHLPLAPIDYRIINSIIVLHLKAKNYLYAKSLLQKAIGNFEKYHHTIRDSSYVRFVYNLARLHCLLNDYEASKALCQKGIDHCLSNNSIAYLADLYVIYGQALIETGDSAKGHSYLQNYVTLRKLYNPDIDYQKTIDALVKEYGINPA